jgi:hypothetical protein
MPVPRDLSPASICCLPPFISPGFFYSITNAAALGLGTQADSDTDMVVTGLPLQRTSFAPLPYLLPPQQEEFAEGGGVVIDGDEARHNSPALAAVADANDQCNSESKRQGNLSAMSDFIDTPSASVSGEVGWVAPVGSYNNRQLFPFEGTETLTISIDCCRFLPHVCCCVQAFVFVVGPGASVLCSFVASAQASSASLSPKFVKGIRASMQWPRVLTLCIFFATIDSQGTFRALASTAHPLLVDASSRRQWSNSQTLPPAGLAWFDGNVQVNVQSLLHAHHFILICNAAAAAFGASKDHARIGFLLLSCFCTAIKCIIHGSHWFAR